MPIPVVKELLHQSVDTGGTANFSLTTAADTPASALLVAINIASYDGVVAANPAAGTWTTRLTTPTGTTNSALIVWTRLAGTAAAQNIAVNNGSSGYGHALICLVLTTLDGTTPWHAGSAAGSPNSSYDISAITTTASDCLEFCIYGACMFGGGAPDTITHPSGMTELLDTAPDSASFLKYGIASNGIAGPGTTSTRTVSPSDTGWVAAHFAIKGTNPVPGASGTHLQMQRRRRRTARLVR